MSNFNYKKLNLAERNAIEQELCKNSSARKIAKMLKRSPSAITEEVKIWALHHLNQNNFQLRAYLHSNVNMLGNIN